MSEEFKTAAEIEKELRAKRQEELNKAEVQEDEQSKKLGIFSLNKSNKGRMLVIVIGVLALLVASAYYLPSFIERFKPEPKKEKTDYSAHRTSGRPTNLGDDVNPFSVGKGASESQSTANSDQEQKPAESVAYSRALDMSAVADSSSDVSRDTSSQSATATTVAATPEEAPVAQSNQVKALTGIRRLPYDPNLFVPENTAIPCSLDRRFISERSGRLTCTINDDIYSANGNVKLIEKGTGATLIYKSGQLNHGQGLAMVMATKLRTRSEPYIEIPLVDTNAAGALGEIGVDGWIDTHFSERFFGAMMIGMIPDVAQWASGAAKNNKDNQTDYTANSRQAFADIAREAFANSVNIPPTLYKNQGEIITLITGQDLDFSSVYKLRMKGTAHVSQ
ncbi:TrbI/VirB10 family protein [Salmonella enterica]|nr:TrbI/VirB10 family protein [Salmonella enterica]